MRIFASEEGRKVVELRGHRKVILLGNYYNHKELDTFGCATVI
jgi:hypothetical protein